MAVGGLTGAGFGVHPGSGEDLILVTSHQGRGVVDCVTGRRLARDLDPDPAWPDNDALTCDGWSLGVVAPDWPNESVLLSKDGDPFRDAAGSTWWHIHREDGCELRAAGFSPTGRTLAVASRCALTLFAHP
ncbi:hypothetical protein [Nonomuraea sp. WAC 01424]|uniref:hypothetical protein n=1 Tax=Nonomuraea sp. WAC 01424 TaxID=2203200 RepID=UPI001C8C476C|nr:hypothetical protein [Nonomuraea sp. WAC 01424]